ncbi:reverse transcriptase domain-containing protein, partial [Burkholderia ubonensis]|uniref:reverse transcriptase domain-containing protein n=1 Tax=Burkholderia ubonensis TaxID=101571 RepID=UPI0039F5D616
MAFLLAERATSAAVSRRIARDADSHSARDGTDRGTPQGGVISPLLANLFLHYAFDVWLGRAMPGVLFERYADDIICHCRTER